MGTYKNKNLISDKCVMKLSDFRNEEFNMWIEFFSHVYDCNQSSEL